MNGSGGGWDDEWDRRAWSRQGPSEPPPPQQPRRDQQWEQQSGYPPPGYDWTAVAAPRPGGGAGVAVAVGVVVLLVIALIVAVVVLVVRSGGDGGAGAPVAGEEMVTVTSTAPPEAGETSESVTPSPTTVTTTGAATRASAPSGLVEECIDEGDTELPRAGRGTEVTSCAFAISVREAYLSTARPGDPAAVEARSPVTGQTYSMGCLGGEVVTCRGGNDAVVYIY